VAWTLSHRKGAGLIESPRRGVYRITERGRQALSETATSNRVDLHFLSQFPEYRQFRSGEHGDAGSAAAAAPPTATEADAMVGTPTERIEAAYQELRRALAVDLLERVREQTPDFFEQVVLDVLEAIGYGGSREDAADRLGRSGRWRGRWGDP
jgi:restriction system protein